MSSRRVDDDVCHCRSVLPQYVLFRGLIALKQTAHSHSVIAGRGMKG
jgi:hypothetical protein